MCGDDKWREGEERGNCSKTYARGKYSAWDGIGVDSRVLRNYLFVCTSFPRHFMCCVKESWKIVYGKRYGFEAGWFSDDSDVSDDDNTSYGHGPTISRLNFPSYQFFIFAWLALLSSFFDAKFLLDVYLRCISFIVAVLHALWEMQFKVARLAFLRFRISCICSLSFLALRTNC